MAEGKQTLVDYDGGTNPVYIGEALSGAAVGDAAWTISKVVYDGSGNATSVKWASRGSNLCVWNDRASLTYA